MKVNVRVLYTGGCDHTPPTIDLVKNTASEMGIDIDLKTIEIQNQEQAKSQKFLGSPTVQVNGMDVDPSARSLNAFGFM
jgi:3'-phosphoadenosine 5'-phosphosulfate sulfotransferase (PAPS reductase)/FAD synthetase